jgi:hypothetical protein
VVLDPVDDAVGVHVCRTSGKNRRPAYHDVEPLAAEVRRGQIVEVAVNQGGCTSSTCSTPYVRSAANRCAAETAGTSKVERGALDQRGLLGVAHDVAGGGRRVRNSVERGAGEGRRGLLDRGRLGGRAQLSVSAWWSGSSWVGPTSTSIVRRIALNPSRPWGPGGVVDHVGCHEVVQNCVVAGLLPSEQLLARDPVRRRVI